MSHAEALEWMEYFSMRGTGNLGLRFEIMIAQLMEMTMKASNRKKQDGTPWSVFDWAIHVDKPGLTIESAMKALGIRSKEDG